MANRPALTWAFASATTSDDTALCRLSTSAWKAPIRPVPISPMRMAPKVASGLRHVKHLS